MARAQIGHSQHFEWGLEAYMILASKLLKERAHKVQVLTYPLAEVLYVLPTFLISVIFITLQLIIYKRHTKIFMIKSRR